MTGLDNSDITATPQKDAAWLIYSRFIPLTQLYLEHQPKYAITNKKTFNNSINSEVTRRRERLGIDKASLEQCVDELMNYTAEGIDLDTATKLSVDKFFANHQNIGPNKQAIEEQVTQLAKDQLQSLVNTLKSKLKDPKTRLNPIKSIERIHEAMKLHGSIEKDVMQENKYLPSMLYSLTYPLVPQKIAKESSLFNSEINCIISDLTCDLEEVYRRYISLLLEKDKLKQQVIQKLLANEFPRLSSLKRSYSCMRNIAEAMTYYNIRGLNLDLNTLDIQLGNTRQIQAYAEFALNIMQLNRKHNLNEETITELLTFISASPEKRRQYPLEDIIRLDGVLDSIIALNIDLIKLVNSSEWMEPSVQSKFITKLMESHTSLATFIRNEAEHKLKHKILAEIKARQAKEDQEKLNQVEVKVELGELNAFSFEKISTSEQITEGNISDLKSESLSSKLSAQFEVQKVESPKFEKQPEYNQNTQQEEQKIDPYSIPKQSLETKTESVLKHMRKKVKAFQKYTYGLQDKLEEEQKLAQQYHKHKSLTVVYKGQEQHFAKPYESTSYDRVGNKLDIYFFQDVLDSEFFQNIKIEKLNEVLACGFVGPRGQKGLKYLTDDGSPVRIGNNSYLIELKFIGNQQVGGSYVVGDCRIIGLFHPTLKAVIFLEPAIGHKTISVAIDKIVNNPPIIAFGDHDVLNTHDKSKALCRTFDR